MPSSAIRIFRPFLRNRTALWTAFVWLAITGLATANDSTTEEESSPITVGVLTDNYPYSYLEKDGSQKGFVYDLLVEIEETLGLSLVRVQGSTKEINPAFERGDLRLVQSFSYTPSRDEWADFSVPYLSMAAQMFARPETVAPRNFTGLGGRSVAVHRGSLGESMLLAKVPDAEIVYVASVVDAFHAVESGVAEFTLASNLTGQATAYLLEMSVVPVGAPIKGYQTDYRFAVREGDTALVGQLNEGIAILQKNGEYERIYQEYFSRYDTTRYTGEDILLTLVIGLGLAFVASFVGWFRARRLHNNLRNLNESLRTEVHQRTAAQIRAEQLNEKLFEQTEKALHADRAKSDFLAKMSHEIRTPMHAIIGMNQFLLDTPLSTQQREFADVTLQSAESLLSILDDILDLSRIEAGKLEMNEESFDLRALVATALDMVSIRAEEADLELGSFISHEVPNFWIGDAGRLRQVILNLLGNAVKYTDSGSVHLHVSIDGDAPAEGDRRLLRFEIVDTGAGVPSELRKTLFDPFVQADNSPSRRYGGAGLGLAISKQIVAAAGGEIGVRPGEEKGSVFWFTLPLVSVSADRYYSTEWAHGAVLVHAVEETTRQVIEHFATPLGVPLRWIESKEDLADALAHPPIAAVLWELEAEVSDAGPSIPDDIPLSLILGKTQHIETSTGERAPLLLRKPLRFRDFRRILPSTDSSSKGADSAEEPKNTADENSARLAGLDVLVVEDNRTNRRVIELLLNKVGIDATFARDGIEALEALASKSFDLTLMDCQMPRMDGYEATRTLRARDGDGAFVVAMTANTMSGDRERCLEAGMDDFLAKPTREEDLLRILNLAVDRRSGALGG